MPTDKRNLITTKALGLISTLFDIASSLLSAPAAASWFYLCFPLCSIPFPTVWWFAVGTLWLRCKTKVSTVLAGAFLMLFFAWNVAERVWRARSETKHNDTPWSSDTPTFKSINGVHTLMVERSIFSTMARLIVQILFVLFSTYNTV